jgi:hypothetical protein
MAVDNTSASRKLTVTNHTSSGTSLQIQFQAGTPQSGFDQANGGSTCGSYLDAFASCDYLLNFTPLSLGAKTGTVSIDTGPMPTTDGLEFSIALSGTGTPQTVVSPASINFGTITVGVSSAAKTVKLTNEQPIPIAVNLAISGSGFAIASGGSCGSSLAAKSSCTIAVTFAPVTGGSATGTLTITDAPDEASPHSVSLRGDGIQLQ